MAAQGFTNWEILETYEDGWLAGDREIELQKEYGYQVDQRHYMDTINLFQSGKSEETNRKISESMKGKVLSEETKAKLSIASMGNTSARGSIRTPENRKKISDSLMGNVVHEKTRNKISNTMKGRKQPIVTCPHCGKEGGQNAMTRRHFDNCKQKEANRS